MAVEGSGWEGVALRSTWRGGGSSQLDGMTIKNFFAHLNPHFARAIVNWQKLFKKQTEPNVRGAKR